jgi:hypothetical protein
MSSSPVQCARASARSTPNARNIASLSRTSSDVCRESTPYALLIAMIRARSASADGDSSICSIVLAAHIVGTNALPAAVDAVSVTGKRFS